MSLNKKSYFQGGGGINEPTPNKKKYKSDPAILVQPRFEEPFFRNYDAYETPGKHSPGSGWHSMQKYKSVAEFLAAKRKRMKDKYKADDSWILDNGNKTKKNPNKEARLVIFERIIKIANDKNDGNNFDYGQGFYSNMDKYDSLEDFQKKAPQGVRVLMDSNSIDFPLDDQINTDLAGPDDMVSGDNNPVGQANLTGGYLDEYTPENDFENKSPENLDFGRDYINNENSNRLQKLTDKYLSPAESELFGLPDGIDPISDLDADNTINNENSERGITDTGTQIYDDKWNI